MYNGCMQTTADDALSDIELKMFRSVLEVGATLDPEWVARLDARLAAAEDTVRTLRTELRTSQDDLKAAQDDLDRLEHGMIGVRQAHPAHDRSDECQLCQSIQYANGADFALAPWLTGSRQEHAETTPDEIV